MRREGTGNGEQGRRNKSVLSFFQKSNMSPILPFGINKKYCL
ncbi:hypothetical protein FDUTEX481_02554 [Tolypothrix sp. PCC 7601]|nr:hypothetical protein FDUTEX481_02554 [Tolypothrix sp. PCC 7601]